VATVVIARWENELDLKTAMQVVRQPGSASLPVSPAPASVPGLTDK
jgi:hypothetical protein